MLFEGEVVRLDREPREHRARPAIDALFRSASAAFGGRVVGVLLSGMGGDGVPGLIEIESRQGLSLVQCPEDFFPEEIPGRTAARFFAG